MGRLIRLQTPDKQGAVHRHCVLEPADRLRPNVLERLFAGFSALQCRCG